MSFEDAVGAVWGEGFDPYAWASAETTAHRAQHDGCGAFQTSVLGARALWWTARAAGARRILEVGTALGYSGLWLADAVGPDGRLDTIEMDAGHCDLARAVFARAGFGARVNIFHGSALEVLSGLSGPYDYISIDIIWHEYPLYYDHFLRLLQPGGVLATSNLFGLHEPGGEREPELEEYLRRLFADPAYETAVIGTRAYSLRRPDQA
jgi:predicted O-methyltransferase YrrM